MNWPTSELRKEDVEVLLHQQLKLDMKVISYKTWTLTQPGDNYSSTMLAVDIIFQCYQETPKKLSLVAKLLPPTQFLREVINIDITFRKEVNAYTLVFPELHDLQREKGILENNILNIVPKFYGSRINRQGDINEKADENAILLLENLKPNGYDTGDRRNGLNLNHMQLGVTQLAQFHALSVGLKILKPKIFKNTVLKASESYKIASQVDETGLPKWIGSTMSYVKAIPECEPHLQRIETALTQSVQNVLPPKEPFSTFIHNDLWVNNILFQYQKEKINIPIGVKFVDFQLTQFSSPAKDLIFFLYSSAMQYVIDDHYNDLLLLYHSAFTNCLRNLGCYNDSFSFENLQEEIDIFGSSEFAHILMMLKFICADKDQLPELTNDSIEQLLETNTGGVIYANRVIHLIEDFSNKGWL